MLSVLSRVLFISLFLSASAAPRANLKDISIGRIEILLIPNQSRINVKFSSFLEKDHYIETDLVDFFDFFQNLRVRNFGSLDFFKSKFSFFLN